MALSTKDFALWKLELPPQQRGCGKLSREELSSPRGQFDMEFEGAAQLCVGQVSFDLRPAFWSNYVPGVTSAYLKFCVRTIAKLNLNYE